MCDFPVMGLVVQYKNVETLCTRFYLEPMAGAREQWKPVNLAAAMIVALKVHGLAIPVHVEGFWLNTDFPIFKEGPREDMVHGAFPTILNLPPTPSEMDSAEVVVSL